MCLIQAALGSAASWHGYKRHFFFFFFLYPVPATIFSHSQSLPEAPTGHSVIHPEATEGPDKVTEEKSPSLGEHPLLCPPPPQPEHLSPGLGSRKA